jgi:NADPH:quinone reductase-like Zn-dependent oxidoreductase
MYASSKEQMLNYLSVCRPPKEQVWENKFLDNVINYYDYNRELTEKQWAIVEDIYSKAK